MAYSVRNTYDKNFKLASNWFEEEKRYNNEASFHDDAAKTLQIELKEAIKNKQDTIEEGGIWVYHKLVYKKYLYKCYSDPYKLEWIYLFSKDGEKELWQNRVDFSEEQLSTLLRLTGTKYTVKQLSDYEM